MMALSVDDWWPNKNDTLMKSLKLVHSKPSDTEQQNCHSTQSGNAAVRPCMACLFCQMSSASCYTAIA